MHGRKKVVQTETEKKVLREKAAAYSAVASAVMDKKQKKDHNEESLLLTEKLLKSNPDFYSLWNFRRHILIHIYPESFGIYKDITQSVPFSSRIALVESTVKTIVQKELDMSADGIKKNSKSYGAWYHRQWIFDRFQVDISSELTLCSLLLKQDQRNFHCWNYRRYIVQQQSSSLLPRATEEPHTKAEFEFSTEKITENFSNYSAFHHRSVYLKQLFQINTVSNCNTVPISVPSLIPSFSALSLSAASTNQNTLSNTEPIATDSQNTNHNHILYEQVLEQEFALIENAIFTEPDDQSAWWYHQFLLAWMEKNTSPSPNPSPIMKQTINIMYMNTYQRILRQQLTLIESLLSLEPDNKWALVCFVNIYQHLINAYKSTTSAASESVAVVGITKSNEEGNEEVIEWKAERQRVLERLCEIDPSHERRYKYLLTLKTI